MDYYKTLEVSKNASAEEIKKLFEKRLINVIPINQEEMKKNLKKLTKHIKHFLILKKDLNMINMVALLNKLSRKGEDFMALLVLANLFVMEVVE